MASVQDKDAYIKRIMAHREKLGVNAKKLEVNAKKKAALEEEIASLKAEANNKKDSVGERVLMTAGASHTALIERQKQFNALLKKIRKRGDEILDKDLATFDCGAAQRKCGDYVANAAARPYRSLGRTAIAEDLLRIAAARWRKCGVMQRKCGNYLTDAAENAADVA